jgi:L-malate glycosyltransferase
MSRPLRIGFVVHQMQVAGAEVLIRETIRRLGPSITPTIFCLDKLGQIGEELRGNGVEIRVLDRKPGWDFGVSKRLAESVTERRIQVLHAHQYTPFFYSALAKIWLGNKPKLILTEHGRHFPDVVSPPRRAINRLFLDQLADEVNACCWFSAKALSKVDGFRGNRISVILNGIEVDNYRPCDAQGRQTIRERLGLPVNANIIVHVARHHPVKDQATLLQGFANVQHPNSLLVMVGDGPLRGDLEGLAQELGISSRVRFVGIQSNVRDWLAAADVFALTSVSEAASLTVLEAMATGLPVVVSNVGGNPEMVTHEKEGLLFPRGDRVACGEALTRLLVDRPLAERLGQAARERVLNEYRLEQTVEAYAQLYRKLAR